MEPWIVVFFMWRRFQVRKIPRPPGVKRSGSQYPFHGGLNTVKCKIWGAEEKLAKKKKSYLYPMTLYEKCINISREGQQLQNCSLHL